MKKVNSAVTLAAKLPRFIPTIIKFLGLVLLFLITLFIAAISQFTFEIGSKGLVAPEAMTTDASSNVYLADYRGQLQKYNSEGHLLASWGANQGSNLFSAISAVAVDDQNNIYLTELYNGRILKLDKQGHYLAEWGSSARDAIDLARPKGLAFDSKGQLYVLSSCYFKKLDKSGQMLGNWAIVSGKLCQDSSFIALTLDSQDNVYILDSYNRQIYQFDASGQYKVRWGSEGSGDDQFTHPFDLIVDHQGFIYVLDGIGTQRIQKFDISGKFISQWKIDDASNRGGGHLTIDQQQHLYFVDEDKAQVTIYDSNGSVLRKWAVPDLTLPVAIVVAILVTGFMFISYKLARGGSTRRKRITGRIGITSVFLSLVSVVVLWFPIPWNPDIPEPLPAFPGSTQVQSVSQIPKELTYFYCAGTFSTEKWRLFTTTANTSQVVNFYRKTVLEKHLVQLEEVVGSSKASLTYCFSYGRYRYRQPAYGVLILNPADAIDHQFIQQMTPQLPSDQLLILLSEDFITNV